MSEPFLGEIKIWALNFAPRGWAFCDGQTLDIAQNTALFSLLGTTYGGDGRTTFALPDLRGRAPIHVGTGPQLPTFRLGERGGNEAVALTLNELPSHSHLVAAKNIREQVSPIGNFIGDLPVQTTIDSSVQMAAESIQPTGGGQPHDNMQPYLTLNFCIALQGLFPPRS